MKNQLREDAAEIQRLIRHMVLTLAPLESDMHFAVAHWQKNPKDQFWRRSLIRCLLACTEALVWNMRHITPKIASVSCVELTVKDMEVINEKRLVIKDGKSETRPKWLPFRDSIKATFTLFGKVHGAEIIWKDDADFEALCETYEMRNRLMHPKKPFDPNVSDPDIDAAQRGVAWFVREYEGLMDQSGKAMPKILSARKSRP